MQIGAVIRKADALDRAPIVAIIERSSNLSGEEKACAVELLDVYLSKEGQKDYDFAVFADESGEPTGYICWGQRPLTEATYDIYWIVVDPDKRRLGAGRTLVGHALSEMKKVGARIVLAETSGTIAYQGARALYEAEGFLPEAKIADFYRPGDDLVVYVKRV